MHISSIPLFTKIYAWTKVFPTTAIVFWPQIWFAKRKNILGNYVTGGKLSTQCWRTTKHTAQSFNEKQQMFLFLPKAPVIIYIVRFYCKKKMPQTKRNIIKLDWIWWLFTSIFFEPKHEPEETIFWIIMTQEANFNALETTKNTTHPNNKM